MNEIDEINKCTTIAKLNVLLVKYQKSIIATQRKNKAEISPEELYRFGIDFNLYELCLLKEAEILKSLSKSN